MSTIVDEIKRVKRYLEIGVASKDDVVNVLNKMLKEKEPGKVNITITQSDGWKEGNCPFCGMKVDSFYNWSFCGTCGREIKWDE